MSDRQYKGNPYQTPVKLRTNAPRQTGEQSARYTHTTSSKPRLPELDDDDNEDAYVVPKPHSSTIDYRTRTRDRGNPKRTQRVRDKRPVVGKLLECPAPIGSSALLVL